MRRAVEAISALDDEGLLTYGPVSVALTSALWDAPARRDCLERTADAARDAGSLRLLDLTLWSMSIAELKGGTPRRAAQCIEQVRDLRRAIGYDADHVLNPALLAWTGAPREQVEMIAEGARALGMGGVHASGLTALAVRDLADGAYADAYAAAEAVRRRPVPPGDPAGVPRLRRGRGAQRPARARPSPVVDRLEAIAAANGSPWARASRRALPGAGRRRRGGAALPGGARRLRHDGHRVETARTHLLYGEWLRRARRRRDAREHLRRAERALRPVRGAGLRRPGPARARGDRCRRPSGGTGGDAGADHAGADRGPARGGGQHQRRDRRHHVHQRQHRRLPPAQGLPEARHLLAAPAHATGCPGPGSARAATTRRYVVRRAAGRDRLGRNPIAEEATDALHHRRRRRTDLLQGLGLRRYAGAAQPRLAAQRGRLGRGGAVPRRARAPGGRPRPPRPRPVDPELARQRDGHLCRRPRHPDRDPRPARPDPGRPLDRAVGRSSATWPGTAATGWRGWCWSPPSRR